MTDCLVIGGGIIGMMTARTLSKNGFDVVLVDSNNCKKNTASWAGAGIISPLYPWKYSDFVNDLSFKSQLIYKDICNELLRDTGIDPEYIKSGLKMFDEFDNKVAKKWLKNNNINYKIEDNSAIFDIAQIRNPKILQALKADLLNRKVKVIENTTIKHLNIKNNIVFGADNIESKYTIICGGSFSNNLTNYDVFPVKGQMITLQDDSKQVKNICLKNGNYLVPRKDGVIVVGATMENAGYDKKLDEIVKNQLFEFAIDIFPHLKNTKITNHWCGFRPATSGNPIIKKSVEIQNLFINTGHFRNGLNTAPESAKIITNLIKNAN
jgi:glycine oxidase